MEELTPLTCRQAIVNKKMSERQPLLFQPETTEVEEYNVPRPNIRSSPDNNAVQNDDSICDLSTEDLNKSAYNPSFHRTLEHPTSNLDTLIHLLKGNIGTGILAMPDAFKNAGLYVGLFGTLIMGAICTHCMHMLVKSSHELCRRLQQPALSFSEVAYCSFETGPSSLRRYSHLSKKIITTFLFVTQMGFCCVYFVFVAFNVKEVVDHYFPNNVINIKIYLTLTLIPMIPLNLVRNLKYLTPVSLIAALLTILGLGFSFYYILRNLPNTNSVKPVASWAQLPLYFGTAIYAFEGIGVVLPLENNMKKPEDFGGITGVLNTGMTIVACLYTTVGFFGYLKYGENVKGSITLNLPPDQFLSQMVRIVMAAAIFLSYTLQFYVPVNIVEPLIQDNFENNRTKELASTILRIILVLFTFLLAVCVPNLGPIISLVGAVSSSALALIAPPIIDVITFWSFGFGKYKWILWKDLAILVFGLCGFFFGTYASLAQILNPRID